MNAKSFFNIIFNNSSIEELDFEINWCIGTGYFDNIVTGEYAPRIKEGKIFKSTDNNGRHILLIGTAIGNVVLFERYNDPHSQTICANVPNMISKLYPELCLGKISPECISTICGTMFLGGAVIFVNPNIGMVIKNIIEEVLEKQIQTT